MDTHTPPVQRASSYHKQVYLDDLAQEVDAIRIAQRFESITAAMRYLVEAGLAAAGYLPHGD